MATPPKVPNSLLVKRKRDEAPVDILYIQDEESKKRRLTEPAAATFYFKRVSSNAPSTKDNSTAPIPHHNAPPNATNTAPSAQTATPRQFTLSRSRPALNPSSRDPKAKRRKRDDFAVFVEQKQPVKQVRATQDVDMSIEAVPAKEKVLKRPNTRAVKTNKPAVTVTPPTTAGSEVQSGQEVPQAIADLLAEEEKEAESSKPKLKFQPKATPRYKDRHPEKFLEADAMDIDDATSEDGDYVHDTYILEPILPQSPLPQDTIGYLILPSSSDELWGSYLSSSPTSSEGFDTDDEDSNAEDYYGNDYPEDELDSEDERGEGGYRFRQGSDGEFGPEDDEDEDARSDNDSEGDDPFGTGEIGKPAQLKGAGYAVW